MKTLSGALAADGVTLAQFISEVHGDTRTFHGTFHFEGRTLEHVWTQHAGNEDLHPSAASVLGPAIRFSQTAEAANGYEDWARDFSFDPEEWMPRETYLRWLAIAKRLRTFLGDERYEGYNSDLVEHD
jgi:hypothetical protein